MESGFPLRMSIFALTALLLARLMTGGPLAALLLTLQTGRIVELTDPAPTEETVTQATERTQQTQAAAGDVVFSFSELVVPAVSYGCDYRPDLSALLAGGTVPDLTGSAPRVLILHTHATEGYLGTDNSRSLEETENMLAIGAEVARVLELGGISVIHDRTLHDYPDYNAAYAAARETVQRYLAEYPSITWVLDLHRDAGAAGDALMTTHAVVDGQASSQLMLVVGTDSGGNAHPNWEENLSLALKLTAVLEQSEPGITRPVNLRSQRFNMDLCPGSLLVEVGAAGDSLEEAMIAANVLARAIVLLAEMQ